MTQPQPLAFRIGLGYDSHRLGPDGPLRIGGLDVAGDFHAIGHSDADVLLHAVTDALMGAIAGPISGGCFPMMPMKIEGGTAATSSKKLSAESTKPDTKSTMLMP